MSKPKALNSSNRREIVSGLEVWSCILLCCASARACACALLRCVVPCGFLGEGVGVPSTLNPKPRQMTGFSAPGPTHTATQKHRIQVSQYESRHDNNWKDHRFTLC